MFRTRDFILVFTSVAFLVMAIGATIWKQSVSSTSVGEQIQFADVSDHEYTAEVLVPEQISREDRLTEMKKKIAASGNISISAPVVVATEPEEPAVTATEEATSVVQKCPGYTEFLGQWPSSEVKFETVEGARIVYQEVPSVVTAPLLQSSSSQALPTEPERKILVQLPIHSFPLGSAICLSSDVIGVAQDGSLIRNNEAGLYSVFGESTLIGYALDGFPIYGVSDNVVDKCGGATVNGQFGYYLSSNREMILNCFSSNPATI